MPKRYLITILALALLLLFACSDGGDSPVQPESEQEQAPVGPDDIVFDLAEYDGDLIVAGHFSTVGGDSLGCIVQWDGAQWSSVGEGPHGGLYGEVNRVAIYDGKLIAGGDFRIGDREETCRVAAWDGASWTDTGARTDIGWIEELIVHEDRLILLSYSPAVPLQVWDGNVWWDLEEAVRRIHTLASWEGKLVAGGGFEPSDSLTRVAFWDEGEWTEIAPPRWQPNHPEYPVNFASALYTSSSLRGPDGGKSLLFVLGLRSRDFPYGFLYHYDDGRWAEMAGDGFFYSEAEDMADYDGRLWIAAGDGSLVYWGGYRCRRVGEEYCCGWGDGIFAVAVLPWRDDLVVAGSASQVTGIPVKNIALFDGVHFRAVE